MLLSEAKKEPRKSEDDARRGASIPLVPILHSVTCRQNLGIRGLNHLPAGLSLDPQHVRGERIKEDADYEGGRIKFTGLLERAKIPMQLDIAFDDVVLPTADRHFKLRFRHRR